MGSLTRAPVWAAASCVGHHPPATRRPWAIAANSAQRARPDTGRTEALRWAHPPCFSTCVACSGLTQLHANDFAGFLNDDAAGDPDANSDHTTAAPVLPVHDCICFSQKFAAECR